MSTDEMTEPIENKPTRIYKVAPPSKAKPPSKNPFRLPAGNSFLLRRQEEAQTRLMSRMNEKSTYSSRAKARRQRAWRDLSWLDHSGEETVSSTPAPEPLTNDPHWRKAFARAYNHRENISDYISKQKAMFRVEYSKAVKQEVIQMLAEMSAMEDQRLTQAEKLLEEDASMFDDFLRENYRNCALSIKIAEKETKNRLEKVAEIKRITDKITAVKSDISRHEEVLNEYITYQDFLLKLSPPEWQEKQRIRRELAEKIKAVAKEKEPTEQAAQSLRRRDPVYREPVATAEARVPPRLDPPCQNLITKDNIRVKKTPKLETELVGNLEDYEDPQIYFTDSHQLLEIMRDLEEQNLCLIQNVAEMEETLEEFHVIMDNVRKRTEKELNRFTQQIDIITHTIRRERERVADLELKARLFSYGEYNPKDQDIILKKLGKKVAEVYTSCLGNDLAEPGLLQMLTAIEGHLVDLLDCLETVSQDKVLMVEKAHAKERRIRQREEKVRLQKQMQEERLQSTLRRNQADIKRLTSRRLMRRSQPPLKVKVCSKDDKIDPELERHLYFFT